MQKKRATTLAAKPKAQVKADGVPEWLNEMRAITGTTEVSGSGSNPKILAMADTIAEAYPEMTSYCNQYTSDEIAWCGLAVAYCVTKAGIRPPFGSVDTDRFLWAESFASDPGFIRLDAPRLGCIAIKGRDGGNHVTLYESTDGSNYRCRGGNQSNSVNVQSYAAKDFFALVWPKDVPIPPAERRTLEEGDSGADVAEVQRILGLPADGDFGPVTEAGVKGYQTATGLTADGVVGPNTWAKLDALDARLKAGSDHLSDELIQKIIDLAKASALAKHSWPDRGVAPIGYTVGMALAYGLAVQALENNNATAVAIAQAATGTPDKDALVLYADELADMGWDTSQDGIDTLRYLFCFLTALGPRESSGNHWCGRDMSASNTSAETAESGLFQTSWNIKSSSPEMAKLFDFFWADPNGFNSEFDEGVQPTTGNLSNYGSGQGAQYQWLAKFCPAFAVYTTAVGLRVRCQHWGPVARKEVTLTDKADVLFYAVQLLVTETVPEPEPPDPEPVPDQATVAIVTTGSVKVTVNGEEVR
jgi:uncharacterized protein (TIGR02594 family)